MIPPTLRPLVLCAMVIGVMAFGVTAAHGSEWLLAKLNGGKIESIGFLPAPIQVTPEVLVVSHSKLFGLDWLVECSAVSIVDGALQAAGALGRLPGVISGIRAIMKGCKTRISGVTSKACEPNAGGKEPGVIKSNLGHGEIVSENIVRLSPDTGETYATIEMGEECSIGEKIPVLGSLFVKDADNGFLQYKFEHRIEVDPIKSLLYSISKTEEHRLSILGVIRVFLEGTHKGLDFSGHS